MPSLRRLLGIDVNSRSQKRAAALVRADRDLMRSLIQMRKDKGMSQQDVADRLGVSQENISAFERHDNDPKLSSIRRYAHAIEAFVAHAVESDEGQLETVEHQFFVTMVPVVQDTASQVPGTAQRSVSAAAGSVALAA